ncbi:MAG TPA: endonuclease/exonuclease/phosphatase family protein [Nitrospiria bacterium]|nr:endonuclease/exonuclease/phosphatase family protein [Nitrospiria bacterium]
MTMHFRAMTYNIHSGFGERGYDLNAIARAIELERVDLVAMQEVDFSLRRSDYVNQAQWLADHLGMHAIIGGTRRQGRYGNALLTRWTTTYVKNHILTVWPHAGRACLEAHLTTPKGLLRCYVTHLGLLPQERMAQAQRLTREIITVDEGHDPILLMGDFNTVPTSRVSRLLRGRFTDVFAVVGDGRAATFHARMRGVRFDYIYTAGLTPIASHVALTSWAARGSDHLPLVAEFRTAFRVTRT